MDSLLLCNTLDMREKSSERRASTSSIATEDSGYSSIFRTVNSVRVYSSKDEYLVAMIEDLAIWIQMNHNVQINVSNFFDYLETGVILCKQAQMVQVAGETFVVLRNDGKHKLPGKWSNCYLTLPWQAPKFQDRKSFQTFICRDNVANFIGWMRSFGFNESIMFETEDLISRKNIRHVVLALLELARVGGLFGLNVPNLIELEQEIDAEISSEIEIPKEDKSIEVNLMPINNVEKTPQKLLRKKKSVSENKIENVVKEEVIVKQFIKPKPYFPDCDIKSLDEMVRDILLECECESQFPMTRLAEGKYLFGERDLLIFVRILRSHVMVRVGGGWDTLNHLLYKHDTCRKDKPDGTLQVSGSGNREMNISQSKFPKSNSTMNAIKKSSNFKTNRSTKSAEIEGITSRLSSIPSSFNQGKKSSGKVKRRCSLQLPRRPELTMTIKARGSKIPILCRNLKVINEIPLIRKQSDLIDVSETSSAPCSRQQSPILVRRSRPWR